MGLASAAGWMEVMMGGYLGVKDTPILPLFSPQPAFCLPGDSQFGLEKIQFSPKKCPGNSYVGGKKTSGIGTLSIHQIHSVAEESHCVWNSLKDNMHIILL